MLFLLYLRQKVQGATMGNYLLQHYGQWLYEVFFSQIFGLLFFAVPLSVIPALLTTGASYLFLGKVAKIAKVRLKMIYSNEMI